MDESSSVNRNNQPIFKVGDVVQVARGFYEWTRKNNPSSVILLSDEGIIGTIEKILDPNEHRGITWYVIRHDEFWLMPTPAQFVLPVPAGGGGAYPPDFAAPVVEQPGYVALTETPAYAAFSVLARLIVATFDGAERTGWLDALDNALRSGTTGGQLRRIAALRAEVSGEA